MDWHEIWCGTEITLIDPFLAPSQVKTQISPVFLFTAKYLETNDIPISLRCTCYDMDDY